MPSYKVLKSVAHNTGHSFLSDMNFVGTGRAYTMVPEHLYRTAVVTGSSEFQLDLMTGEVSPADFRTKEIRESAENYRRFFMRQIESQGSEVRMVRDAALTISFDLTQSRPAKYEPEQSNPVFNAQVRIVDDRGSVHIGVPANWWRE